MQEDCLEQALPKNNIRIVPCKRVSKEIYGKVPVRGLLCFETVDSETLYCHSSCLTLFPPLFFSSYFARNVKTPCTSCLPRIAGRFVRYRSSFSLLMISEFLVWYSSVIRDWRKLNTWPDSSVVLTLNRRPRLLRLQCYIVSRGR